MVRRLEGAEGNMSSEWSIGQVANLNTVYILILLGTRFILTHNSDMLCSCYRLYLLSDVDQITPEIQSFSLRIFVLLL